MRQEKPAYFQGRISNGPMWVEGFAAAFDRTARASLLFDPTMPEIAATNFSVSGAVTDNTENPLVSGLLQQAEFFRDFVGPFVDTKNSLFVVAGGANDSLLICFENGVQLCDDPLNPPISAFRNRGVKSAKNISKIIKVLYGTGAREFLVMNYPAFVTQEVSQFSFFPAFPSGATQFASFFNPALKAELKILRHELPGIKIAEFDVFKLSRKILLNPEKFGITTIDEACLKYAPLSFPAFEILDVCDNPKEYANFDAVHPSSTIHALWAKGALRALLPKHNLRKRWRLWRKWKLKWKEWKSSF